MFEEKFARKIIRSLPKKFDMKMTAIEEAQDLSSIKVDEIIGFMQTFDMSINERSGKKNKMITFVSNTEGDQGHKEECHSDVIDLLGGNSNQSLKNLDRKWMSNV